MQGKKKGIRGDIHIMNTEIHLLELYFETMMVALGLHGGRQYLYINLDIWPQGTSRGLLAQEKRTFRGCSIISFGPSQKGQFAACVKPFAKSSGGIMFASFFILGVATFFALVSH